MQKITFYNKYHKKNKKYYKTIGDNNFTYYYHIAALRKIKGDLDFKGWKVLDIGCGVGALSFYLASKGAIVEGIDISTSAISICNSYKKNSGMSNISFFSADVEKMVRKKNKYDLVICSEIIEHVQDDQRFLKDVRSLLAPQGYLLLSTPSTSTPLYSLGLLKKFDQEVGHLRRYTAGSLHSLVVKNGLAVVSEAKNESFLRNALYITPLGKVIKFIRGPFVELFHIVDKILTAIFGESDLLFILQRK